MKHNAIDKNNAIFIILLFIIPFIALNSTIVIFSNINNNWAKKEQAKAAKHEVEILSSEADFSNQFASHFERFFEKFKNEVNDIKDKTLLENRISKSLEKIFVAPFPQDYSLYTFKIASNTNQPDIIFSRSDVKIGKRVLCKAFEQLYKINTASSSNSSVLKENEAFLRQLLGKFTDIETVGVDSRGTPTFTNGAHHNSWFIWDYEKIEGKGIFGAILLCKIDDSNQEIGRLLALKNLKERKTGLGAFLPLYKDYGKPVIQYPLEKSETFKKWAESITIQDIKDIDRWLNNSLPQNVTLGNYTAFTFLDRGASHISVYLVKSLKGFKLPKWLINLNIISFLLLLLLLYLGIFFNKWIKISLKVRFALSYMLASFIPLSILFITAYGYILQYKNTSVENTASELQTILKSFDVNKLSTVSEYKSKFTETLYDNYLVDLIKEKGGIDKDVVGYVLNKFESNSVASKSLPLLSVEIIDENGNFFFLNGKDVNNSIPQNLIDSFKVTFINLLRTKIKREKPNKKWDIIFDESKDIVASSYNSLREKKIQDDMIARFSLPVPIKNDKYTIYQLFDTIKIDGESKYLLSIFWNDQSLDNITIKEAINDYTIANLNNNSNQNQTFIAYKINGQNIVPIETRNRIHGSQKLLARLPKLAKQALLKKKIDTYYEEDNLIVVMPSINFYQTVLIGCVSKENTVKDILNRENSFIFLVVLSLIIIYICSLKAASVFIRPVSALKAALNEISAGNLNISLNNIPQNEFGNLSDEFSKMFESLREKERISKLISDQAVQALQKKSNGLLNDTETFKGVALVSDIRNFTGMSEKYEPTLITDLLNQHFAEMAKIILDNGGQIYKFIGDAIEAVFPEKEGLEQASYRAFKAGCRMIAKLAHINAERKRKNLFTYRIGIGLNYGVMYSGSVGSLETRLDYAIIGEPLKNAAKLEALSIHNPAYPLVTDEYISNHLSTLGFGFKKLDIKDFSAYILEEIGTTSDLSKNSNLFTNDNSENDIKDIKNEETKYFYLQQNLKRSKIIAKNIFNSIFMLLNIFLIVYGIYFINTTINENLKFQSKKECSRLIEQLKSNDVLKSAFESLCLDFSEKIRNKIDLNKDDTKIDKIIKSIHNEYENKGLAIPYYCYIYQDKEANLKFVSHNFSSNFIYSIRKNKNIFNKYLWDYCRQSNPLYIDNKNLYVFFDKIKKTKEMPKYNLICGLPVASNDIPQNIYLPKYYTLMSGEEILLALNKGDKWVFSDNFTSKEIEYLKSNYKNENLIKNKGYIIKENEAKDAIKIKDDKWTVYAIKKDLVNKYDESSYFVILVSFLILFIIIGIFMKGKINAKVNSSISSRLMFDILLSAFLPISIVCFLSIIYVIEDYSIKKSEMIINMNQQLDDIERKELYYHPYCSYSFKDLSNSKIKGDVLAANNEEGKNNKIYKNRIKSLFDENIERKSSSSFNKNFFYEVEELLLLSKNNWTVSSSVSKNNSFDPKTGLSQFGNIFSELLRYLYLNKNDIKGELVFDTLVQNLKSYFGRETINRLFNCPNIIQPVTVSYSTTEILISPVPSFRNPDYIFFSFLIHDEELLSELCKKRNSDTISYDEHIASGSNDNKIFVFNSTSIHIGERFIDDTTLIHQKTLKEFLLASYWLKSSFIPVSRLTNLFGGHYLEIRRGNTTFDFIYAALASDKYVKQQAYSNLPKFGFLIFISFIVIYIIAKTIISDLLAPVKLLIFGAKNASIGNYSYRIIFNNRGDELSILCNSFNQMMKSLEEKELMNRMISKSALKISSNEFDTSSKKINSVLLYITIPNFDQIMKNTPTYELFMKLKKQIAIISEIILKNGGDIDKIIGEKMLIAFQLGEKSLKEVALSACNAAIEIENNNQLSYKVSIGVNSGQVISGFLGVGEKRDFTIIGDPVNVAARIAVYAEKLDNDNLILSENIMNLVCDKIKTEEYGEVLFKGKTQASKVYQIV